MRKIKNLIQGKEEIFGYILLMLMFAFDVFYPLHFLHYHNVIGGIIMFVVSIYITFSYWDKLVKTFPIEDNEF